MEVINKQSSVPRGHQQTRKLTCYLLFIREGRRHGTELIKTLFHNRLSLCCHLIIKAHRSGSYKLWPVAFDFTCGHQSLMWVTIDIM